MNFLRLFLLAFGAVPSVVAAQVQQTPQGAHEFLRIIFSGGGVSGYLDYGQGENVGRMSWYTCRRQMTFAGSELMPAQYEDVCGNTQFGQWTGPAYKAIKYQPTDNICLGRLSAAQPQAELSFSQGNTHYTREPLRPLQRYFIWAKVAEVARYNEQVTVKEGDTKLRFILPSVDVATRVAFAMEFLRVHCDSAAATGF